MAIIVGDYTYDDVELLPGVHDAPYEFEWIEPYRSGRTFKGKYIRVRIRATGLESWWTPEHVIVLVDDQQVPTQYDTQRDEVQYLEMLIKDAEVRTANVIGVEL